MLRLFKVDLLPAEQEEAERRMIEAQSAQAAQDWHEARVVIARSEARHGNPVNRAAARRFLALYADATSVRGLPEGRSHE